MMYLNTGGPLNVTTKPVICNGRCGTLNIRGSPSPAMVMFPEERNIFDLQCICKAQYKQTNIANW